MREMLVGEVEEARKDAQTVAMTREEAAAQLAALEEKLAGLMEEQQELKVGCSGFQLKRCVILTVGVLCRSAFRGEWDG